MSHLLPFQFKDATIRVITDSEGAVWFIARDVATTLGYGNTKQAVIDHCKKVKSLKYIGVAFYDPEQNQLLSLDQQTKLIPESDVYRLVIRSKLESAEAFQDWLVEEVLPSIRKTGSYSMTDFNTPKTFAEALRLAADAQEKLELAQAAIEKQNQTIKSKDELILASNEASIKAGEILIREFVKSVDIIDLGEKQFYAWMREQGLIMESREPYSEYVKKGYFTWKPTEKMHGGEYRYTLRVTPRGKVWLAAKYMMYIDAQAMHELIGDAA